MKKCIVNQFDILYIKYFIYNFTKEGIYMLKFLAKTAEKYAKATNTACAVFAIFHQPNMPKSMMKKD